MAPARMWAQGFPTGLRAAMAALAIAGGSAWANGGTLPAGFDAFNKALAEATRHMDTAATLALWEDDGISLLPETPPLVGKGALQQMYDAVAAQLPGARMQQFDLACFDAEVTGDSGSEWCEEHQVIVSDKGVLMFDGRGRMLLMLHRDSAGQWRIRREMWVPAEAPDPAPPRG